MYGGAALFVVSDVGLRHCRSMLGCGIFVGVLCCHGDVSYHHEGVISLLGCGAVRCNGVIGLWCHCRSVASLLWSGIIIEACHHHWGELFSVGMGHCCL